ncbi:MAG: hypothetical protein HY720_20935 [Planctomycetes bacterium]|nr:hypothetical protein [Planctomycetota bacterium]
MTRERSLAAVWYTEAQDEPHVRLAVSTDCGENFAPPVDLDGGRPLGRVDACFLADGSVAVSWLERVSEGAQVRIRRVAPDGSMSEPVAVATVSSSRASGVPRIVPFRTGVLVAWTEPNAVSRLRVAVVE